MGLPEILPHLQLSFNAFAACYILVYCLILVQMNIVLAESNENASKTLERNTTVFSFTEEFIAKRAGRKVDVKKLLTSYTSICPLQETCGVNIDNNYLFPGEIYPEITGCYGCTCNQTCVFDGNCCPGAHYGYYNYRCVNINLYPKNTEHSYEFSMVGTCLDNYNENKTIIELCKEKVEPCTGTESMLNYKNKYCGICNKELDCISWEIEVYCINASVFVNDMQSFSSAMDMKRALDTNDCFIRFQLPNDLGFACNEPNVYLSKHRVDRCNVSGIWNTYDEDIDWACANFITPYKNFKNVFCYICNPSHANMQAVSLIDKCSPGSKNVEAEISQACESFPESDRLAPFKNVYCYVCSEGYKLLFEENENTLQYIREDNTLDLQTRLDIAITFSGEHNLENVKTYVDDLLSENFNVREQDTTAYESTKMNYDALDLSQMVYDYTTVCGTRTLCNLDINTNNTHKLYGNPVCKTCTCDRFCAENESCCPDILFTKEPYSCYIPRMFQSFYRYQDEQLNFLLNISSDILTTDSYLIIDKCLNEHVTHLPNKCSVYNYTQDHLSRIPVSTETGMTYKNVYCYECNNNTTAITLKFQVVCKTYMEESLFTNTNRLMQAIKLYCDQIVFIPIQNKLCPHSFNSEKASLRDGEKFIRRELHPSQFEFSVPAFEKEYGTDFGKPVRTVFDRCNKTGFFRNGESDVVTSICESDDVNMMFLQEYRIDQNVYKNFACFLCNPEHDLSTIDSDNVTSSCLSNNSIEWYVPNETLEELCNETELHPRWHPYKNMYCAECNLPPWQQVEVILSANIQWPAAGYKYIFSLSSADFEHLDEVLEKEVIPNCIPGTYDYALKHCRSLSCNDGFQLFNNTCKPMLESAINQKYSLSFNLHYTSEDGINLYGNQQTNTAIIVNLETFCSKIVENLTSLFGETTEYFIEKKECIALPCVSIDNKGVLGNIHFVDVVRTDKFNIHLTILIIKTEAISTVHTVLLNALNKQFYIFDILDLHGLPKTILMHSKPNVKDKKSIIDMPDLRECKWFQFSLYQEFYYLDFTHYTIDTFLTCAQVKLNMSEVVLDTDSNNISLKKIDATFSDWEYKIVDKSVAICADLYTKRTFIEPDFILYIQTDHIKSVFIVFSFICTLVSLVCLFLTFITYCFIPSIRTIAGKNIMALCISLFFSQALLQFGINAKEIKILCVTIGISVHLFWLVSFCAMNTCSFHTFKVFYYNDFENRNVSKQSDNYLFLKYSLYMICLPVFMVLVTISASLIKSDDSDIGYGRYYCFVSNFYIFIFTFITPACLLFASNIVFFSMAFHKIRSSPNVPGARDRNNFYICLRLFTIVGIAWPLLIIDSSLGLTWFSFIVAGVNSLQGVFIFVSFVFNRRIASLLVSTIMEKL